MLGNDFNLMSNLITNATHSFATEIRKIVGKETDRKSRGEK